MIVKIELENSLGANLDGKNELKRIFDDLINRLDVYWRRELQSYEKWGDTTLIIYNEAEEGIGKFCAEQSYNIGKLSWGKRGAKW